MRNNYKSEYLKYKAQHKALRRQGLIKSGSAGRMVGFEKFKNFAEAQKANEGLGTAASRKQLLLAQQKFGGMSKREIRELYEDYATRNTVSVRLINRVGQHGEIEWRDEEVKHKYRNIETFMRNIKARDIIASLIRSGYTKNEALEAYGYEQDNETVFE